VRRVPHWDCYYPGSIERSEGRIEVIDEKIKQ